MLSFNALQNTSWGLSWLPEAFLPFGFYAHLVAQHQNVPLWEMLLNYFLINIFPQRFGYLVCCLVGRQRSLNFNLKKYKKFFY